MPNFWPHPDLLNQSVQSNETPRFPSCDLCLDFLTQGWEQGAGQGQRLLSGKVSSPDLVSPGGMCILEAGRGLRLASGSPCLSACLSLRAEHGWATGRV